MNPHEFYVSHSPITDPSRYAYLLDDLPDDLEELCRVVQGIYIHYMVAQSSKSGVPRSHLRQVDSRYVEVMLAQVIALSDRPLMEPRPVQRRFVGCCRDAALLLCAMLRHKGIPAIARAGFATYINIGAPSFNVDHV